MQLDLCFWNSIENVRDTVMQHNFVEEHADYCDLLVSQ